MGKKITVETNYQVFKIYIGPNTGDDSSADISGIFSKGHTFEFDDSIKTTDFVYKFYAFQYGDYYYTPDNTGWQHVYVSNHSYVNYNGYSARYNPPKRTLELSVSPAGSGSVSGAGEYDAGSTVRISASAASGYKFLKWSDGDTNSTRDIVLDNDRSLTAYFEKVKCYIYFYKDTTETYPSYITVVPKAHTWVYHGDSFTLPGNLVSKAQINNGPYTIIFVPANGSSNITSSYYHRTKYTQNGWAYHNTTT